MPTSRSRHLLAEAERVAQAIDDAAGRWPSERGRSELLPRLIEAGHRAVRVERAEASTSRLAAFEDTDGVFRGMYGENYLEELRHDWPA